MFHNMRSFALAAMLFTQQIVLASAGHSQFHQHRSRLVHRHHRNHQLSSLEYHHQERSHPKDVSVKRDTVTVQDLQIEVTAFSTFMTAYFASANATDPSYLSPIKGEVELHQASVQKWIDEAASSFNVQQLQLEYNAFAGWMDAWFGLGTATSWTSAVALLSQEVQAYVGWLNAWIATANPNVPVPTPTGASQPSTTALEYSSATPPPTSSLVATSVLAATIVPSPSSQPSNSGSAFNPKASDNVAVYFGQTPKTIEYPLKAVCADDKINIIVVAFVNGFFDANGTGFPTVNFGGAGGYLNPAMEAAGATGLLQADELASNISACQAGGKIVLMSLGGALGTSVFTSDAQAVTFAEMLWNLFGAGNGTDPKLRPFGSVVVDGFDFDNESHNPTGYTALTTALRTQFAKDPSKKYYISAAPQCPRPDASTPLEAMIQMDFVWIQFYNNPQCNLGSAGFLASAQAWFSDLNNGSKPMMYVAAPADKTGGSGYLPIDSLAGEIKKVRALNMSNLGGVTLWDGSEALAESNMQDGIKSALKD